MRRLALAAALLSLCGCEFVFNGEKKFASSGSSSGSTSTSGSAGSTSSSSSSGSSSGSSSASSSSGSSGSSGSTSTSGSSGSTSSSTTTTSSTSTTSTSGGTTGAIGLFDATVLNTGGNEVTCSNAAELDGALGPDLMLGLEAGATGHAVAVLLSAGDGGFVDAGLVALDYRAVALTTSVVNGLPAVVALTTDFGSNVELESAQWSGAGFAATQHAAVDPALGLCGDVEGDPASGAVAIGCANGVQALRWSSAWLDAGFWAGSNGQQLGFADVNQDGQADIFWASTGGASSALAWVTQTGGVFAFAGTPCGGIPNATGDLIAADMNADGVNDIIASAQETLSDGGQPSFQIFFGNVGTSPYCDRGGAMGDTASYAVAAGRFGLGALNDVAALEASPDGGGLLQIWKSDEVTSYPGFHDGGVNGLGFPLLEIELHRFARDGGKDDLLLSGGGSTQSQAWVLHQR